MNYEDKTLTCEDCGQPATFHAMKRDGGNSQGKRDMYPWYTPIVVKTPPSRFSPMVTARSTAATASASGARPWGWAGREQ